MLPSPTTYALRGIASLLQMSIFSAISIASSTLDAEIPNGALDLRMPEQELHSTQIAGAAIDKHGLHATQGVRAELCRIQTDTRHPLLYETSILARSQTWGSILSSDEQHLTWFAARQSQVLIDRHPRVVGQLE